MRNLLLAATLFSLWMAESRPLRAEAQPPRDRSYTASAATLEAIEQAVPETAAVQPQQPRKVLVYGRMPTHPESVVCCFHAMKVLGEKTGAFHAVSSGDPLAFSAENLRQFDAVIMNNTHERYPMLPADFEQLDPQQQAAAKAREPALKKSLLDFIAAGKGIVGVHGATAGNVQWPEFVELFGAQYGGHFTDDVWIKPEDPNHPLVDFLQGDSFQVRDEFYVFRQPFSREPFLRNQVRVLLSLDLAKTKDPGLRADKDYLVSWIREYEKGRVFYFSLGHTAQAYASPAVLRHYLAGIQFAIGDLAADATPHAAK